MFRIQHHNATQCVVCFTWGWRWGGGKCQESQLTFFWLIHFLLLVQETQISLDIDIRLRRCSSIVQFATYLKSLAALLVTLFLTCNKLFSEMSSLLCTVYCCVPSYFVTWHDLCSLIGQQDETWKRTRQNVCREEKSRHLRPGDGKPGRAGKRTHLHSYLQ